MWMRLFQAEVRWQVQDQEINEEGQMTEAAIAVLTLAAAAGGATYKWKSDQKAFAAANVVEAKKKAPAKKKAAAKAPAKKAAAKKAVPAKKKAAAKKATPKKK